MRPLGLVGSLLVVAAGVLLALMITGKAKPKLGGVYDALAKVWFLPAVLQGVQAALGVVTDVMNGNTAVLSLVVGNGILLLLAVAFLFAGKEICAMSAEQALPAEIRDEG